MNEDEQMRNLFFLKPGSQNGYPFIQGEKQ